MSYEIDPKRAAVSFVFAIARRMPRNSSAVQQIPAVAAQLSMLGRRAKANELVSKSLHFAVTTYRHSIFVDHPTFALAAQQALADSAELLLADPFSYMRNLESEAAFRCMRTLDALPISITNAHDGRPWASYSTPEKQSLYLAAKSATTIHGNRIRRHLPVGNEPKSRVSAETRERAGATLSRNADRRALELKSAVERIRNDAGDVQFSPTLVAKELNKLGIKSARGDAWSTTTAKRLLLRLKNIQGEVTDFD